MTPARITSHCLSGVPSAKAYLMRGKIESPATPMYEAAFALRIVSMVTFTPAHVDHAAWASCRRDSSNWVAACPA